MSSRMSKIAWERLVNGLFDASMEAARKQLSKGGLPVGEKVVLRVEIRRSGMYLEARLSDLGDDGQVHRERTEYVEVR